MSDKGGKKKKAAGKKAEAATGQAALPFELAYEQGNYAGARRLARAALEGPDAARAREVLERIGVSRIPLLVFAGSLLLFTLVALLGLH